LLASGEKIDLAVMLIGATTANLARRQWRLEPGTPEWQRLHATDRNDAGMFADKKIHSSGRASNPESERLSSDA